MRSKEEQEIAGLLASSLEASREANQSLRRVLGQAIVSASSVVDNFPDSSEDHPHRESQPSSAKRSASSTPLRGASGVEILQQQTPPASSEDDDWLSPGVEDVRRFVDRYVAGLVQVVHRLSAEDISQFVDVLLQARARDKQIFIIGNGGSASLASHLATDLVKERFPDPRYLFRVMSLTDNAAVITATANDFGYDLSFANQLKPWVREDDVVVAISSSGNSPNIVKAIEVASNAGAHTVGLLGFDGGKAASLVDTLVRIPCEKGQYGFAEDVTSILAHMVTVMIFEHDRKNFELARRAIGRISKKNGPTD
jgi:D-sedoheptulose 7-phosphate isomerase